MDENTPLRPVGSMSLARLRQLALGKRRFQPLVRRSLPDWASRMLAEARKRAKKKRVPFALKSADLLDLIDAQGGVCAISGLSFSLDGYSGTRRPFAPSLDRIDPRLGYIPGNVRVVCLIVNMAMNVWGEDPLRQLVAAMGSGK